MKIRHPWLLKLVGFVGAWVIRGWIGTLRYRYRPLGPNVDPHQPGLGTRYIYAAWHENMLLLAYHYGRPDIFVLISQHADGEMIAEVCRHLRFRLIRGSTTRGGVESIRRMLRLGRQAHLAITPDGPRGPRRHVHQGLIYLAARTGMPIVPVGVGFERPWRMRSWDRFAVPRPWSLSVCVTGPVIQIPPDLDRDQLEQYRLAVEEAMAQANAAAERLAEGGKLPPRSSAPVRASANGVCHA